MKEEQLEIQKRQLKYEYINCENKLAKVQQSIVAERNRFNNVNSQFKKIKDQLKSVCSSGKNPQTVWNISKEYLSQIREKEILMGKLKNSLVTQKKTYSEVTQNLKRISMQKDKINSAILGLRNKRIERNEESNIEDIVSINIPQDTEEIKDTLTLEKNVDLMEQIVSTNEITPNSMAEEISEGRSQQQNLSNGENQENTAANPRSKESLEQDTIEQLKSWKDTSGTNISLSYSTSDNGQISLQLSSVDNKTLKIVLVPQLLKHRLRLWQDTPILSAALQKSGFNVSTLNVTGGVRNV